MAVAAKRLRSQLREEYRDRQRRIGWRYVPGVLLYCAFASLLILWLAWTTGREAAWFAAGLGTGASSLLLWIALQSDRVMRLDSAAHAEEWVASELGKLRRDGWTVLNNVSFKPGDVDHVAIGPGGIVVIETKSSEYGWDGTLPRVRRDIVAMAEDQLRKSVPRVDAVLAQNGCKLRVTGSLIAACGEGRPDGPTRTPGGLRVVPTDALGAFMRSLPPVLDDAGRTDAVAALMSYVEGRESHQRATVAS